MDLTHPNGYYQQIPPENVFFAVNQQNMQVGVGTIEYQYFPHFSPERPVHLHFRLNAKDEEAWYMLMGALMARARQMRDAEPDLPARMYTTLPADSRELTLYENVGMDCRQCKCLIGLQPRGAEARSVMGFVTEQIPLNTQPEQAAFLDRLVRNDIHHIDLPFLQMLLRQPHVSALRLRSGNDIACEVLMAGSGNKCELVAVYTAMPYRRQGFARRLIGMSMNVMAAEGVEQFAASLSSLSAAQTRLAMSFHGVSLELSAHHPCIDL